MILFKLGEKKKKKKDNSRPGIVFWPSLEVQHVFHGSEPSPALSWIEGFGDVTTFWGGNGHSYAKLPAYKHW